MKGIEIEKQKELPIPVRLGWLWEAFCCLSRCRLTNQTGPQPILMTEVVAYCALAFIERPDDIDDILFFVTELDLVWCKNTHEKIARERKKQADKARR